MNIKSPYLLFLGDVKDPLTAKTSHGLAYWRREKCIGEIRMPDCGITLGLPELTIKQAAAKGAQTFVLGLATPGGSISDTWLPYLKSALENGMDIANGLHVRLNDIAEIKTLADQLGRRLHDVRYANTQINVGKGRKRGGKRVLTVGTDCSVGKMYTSLALEKEMRTQGWNVDFRATGQTGILITGSGISVDAVIADFISGAAEHLTPENSDDHWDIIEGQGSLFHPSYAGVSLGLLHGAQPDFLILCHEVGRNHMRGLPGRPLPALDICIEQNLIAARVTNPDVQMAGIALNTSSMSAEDAQKHCEKLSRQIGIPCVDPVRHGVGSLVGAMVL